MRTPINQITDPRFKRVKFVVFADDRFDIWKEWHNRLTFKDDNMGHCFQYATLGKKPCWGSVYFSEVEGVYTVFACADGSYVDFRAFEETIWELCGLKPTPDNQTNQTNFHNHIAWHTMNPKLRTERLIKDARTQLDEAAQQLTRLILR